MVGLYVKNAMSKNEPPNPTRAPRRLARTRGPDDPVIGIDRVLGFLATLRDSIELHADRYSPDFASRLWVVDLIEEELTAMSEAMMGT
jgi:hypothetical protein